MQQVKTNFGIELNHGPDKNGKIKFLESLMECFKEYFINIFKDFGEILQKKLQSQEKKIRQNERLLIDLVNKIDSRGSLSLTSLAQIQLNEENSNQTSRVKSLSIDSTKELTQLHQFNEALKKLQRGIEYLEASLTFMKSKKSFLDPQNIQTIKDSQIKGIKSEIKLNGNSTTVMSKIQKLSSKINRFAKESSIQQIEKDSVEYSKIKKLEKSRSLIHLSNRRYYPVSCPKGYEYAAFQARNHNNYESQIILPLSEEYSSISTNFSTINECPSILLQQNSKIFEENKMPLINKSKFVLNQLLSLVKDQADVNLVMFYLKKGFKSLQQIGGKQKNSKNQPQGDIRKWEKKGNPFSSYSINRVNTLQAINTFENNENTNSTCSIINMLPNSESDFNQIKENFKSLNSENQHERGLYQNMHQNSQSNLGSNVSRQKRKYFQRTSNQQKMALLKNKLGANC